MNNEKEIPFGAFDSELMHQEIFIPEGFEATIDGNKIILTRIENEDEKIRKALVELVHDTTGDELWVDYNVHKEDALAWLEKQANHANFRNKIQIGDKVTRNKDGVLVNLSQLNRVAKKDEQILANSAKTCKDKQKPDDKIEQKSQRMVSAEAKEALYDKPAWSEEDEEFLRRAINAAKRNAYPVTANWLKSLKERYFWKPSKEQMEAIRIAANVGTANDSWAMGILRDMYNDLKKLKE